MIPTISKVAKVSEPLFEMYGSFGLVVVLLLGAIWYFIAEQRKHRKDRDQWVAIIVDLNESGTDALNRNTEAVAILTVHIENCSKNR